MCKTLLIIYNIVDINTPTEDNENQNLVHQLVYMEL